MLVTKQAIGYVTKVGTSRNATVVLPMPAVA